MSSNEDSGLRMRIDNVPGVHVSAATKSGKLTEVQTSDGEESSATCVGKEHLEGCESVKAKNNNNEYEGHQEKSVSIKHRGSI